MKNNHWVNEVGCWILLSACAVMANGAEYTVELPIAETLTVAYSPSGKQIAVGGLAPDRDGPADGIVALVDVASGKLQSSLRHSGRVKLGRTINPIGELSYSPDGQILAIAANLGLKLWDPTHDTELATLSGYGIDDNRWRGGGLYPSSVAFSPDGTLLAASGDGFRLWLWDVAKREVVRELEIGRGGQSAWAFSPDGAMLVTAGENGRVYLWRVADGKQVAEFDATSGQLHAVAVDPHGKHVAVGGYGAETMWRIESNDSVGWRFVDEVRFTKRRGGSPIYGLAFSPDGRLLVACGHKGALVIYDAQTRQIVSTLLAGGPCAFSPDGTSIAIAHVSRERSPDGQQQGRTALAIWKTAEVLDLNRLAK